MPITIGIGHSTQELGMICESYKDAVNALGYKAIVGTGHTIYINDVEPVSRGKLQFDSKDEAELVGAVKFGPREKIEEVVQRISEKINDAKVHQRQCQTYMLSILNCMIQLVQMYDLDMETIFQGESNLNEAFALITITQKKEDFVKWLLQAATAVNQSVNTERDNTTKQVIQEARQYIMDNYQDADLSVEKICRHLHMSPAYFSTMFKKETGKTYVAYLTEVRLDKAVELLNKTDDKTYVIAAKVGYQEQNYFSYVFKKRFGISPTKFRGAK